MPTLSVIEPVRSLTWIPRRRRGVLQFLQPTASRGEWRHPAKYIVDTTVDWLGLGKIYFLLGKVLNHWLLLGKVYNHWLPVGAFKCGSLSLKIHNQQKGG